MVSAAAAPLLRARLARQHLLAGTGVNDAHADASRVVVASHKLQPLRLQRIAWPASAARVIDGRRCCGQVGSEEVAVVVAVYDAHR